MKLFSTLTILAFLFALSSCKKPTLPSNPERTIRYVLYTDKDFSGDNHIITFSVIMKTLQGKTLFDSSLAPMKVEDIPDSLNRFIIEKKVPNNDTATLVVGFLYSIQDVGNSWYLDSCASTETFKTVNYPFQ